MDGQGMPTVPESISIFDFRPILIFCIVVAALLGAVMGSFLNCAAWRIAHGEKFWKGRSHCPTCGHPLSGADLVPVLSWLFLRGKCRYCGGKVSPRYLLAELFFALVTVLCLLRFDLTVLCLRNWVFLCCLFCLALVDLEAYIIPDGCHLVSLAAWIVALPFLWNGWKDAGLHVLAGVVFGLGILLISLALDRILKKESLGGGDVKLFAVMGLYLGLGQSLLAVILSCVLGLLLGLVKRNEEQHIPFGPAISLATVIVLLAGEYFLNWYLGLFAF